MKLIKAYNMGSKSFQKFSGAIHEENAMWNETSDVWGLRMQRLSLSLNVECC